MGFRTVIVNSHSKLEYSLNSLIFKTAETTKKIFLDEINVLIIQSTAVSITSSLLCELTKRNIVIIFCDEKHNPISQLLPLSNSYNSYKKILEQISWKQETVDNVWSYIIKKKIRNQARTLSYRNKDEQFKQLMIYADEVLMGDSTNREGHAAKVYFNNIYGKDFTRNSDDIINAYLNYGYTVILSLINRTIASYGYLTQLGIHHRGETNPYNLSSDLIEPLRYIVDEEVFEIKDDSISFKDKMTNLINKEFLICGKKQTLSNAIPIYFLSFIDAINNNDPTKIKFIEKVDDDR